MKVTSSTSTSAAGGARSARPAAAAGGFALAGEVSESATAAGAAGVNAVSSLEALIALQSVEGPLERRRRAMGRASRLLDLLDGVKLGLLEGALPADSLQRLTRAVREERDAVEEAPLQALLDEIETRAQVELAKLDMARAEQARG